MSGIERRKKWLQVLLLLFVLGVVVDDESLRTKRFRILAFNKADAPKYSQSYFIKVLLSLMDRKRDHNNKR